MKLTQRYAQIVRDQTMKADASQVHVLMHLQRLEEALASSKKKSWFRRCPCLVRGIYLYGPVGRGKTFLIDLFYQHSAERHKRRLHFHRFMQQIDAELRLRQGQSDPLRRIAVSWAKSTRLLCLDELMVHDIADAMILAELFRAFFQEGIVLVTTSNIPPDDLYLNGLQRARFLPAIDLIKSHCEVLFLNAQQDYRLGRTVSLQAYLHPCHEANRKIFEQQFDAVSDGLLDQKSIQIQNRSIPCVKLGRRSVWFEFDVICNLPRSQLDYLEIARQFDWIFVSHVPTFQSQDIARALLFIRLIDVMYDQKIRVILFAEAPVAQLYSEGPVMAAFKRTKSRLEEMQSVGYVSLGAEGLKDDC